MVRRRGSVALALLLFSSNVVLDVVTAAAVTTPIPAFALKLIVVEANKQVLAANTTEFRAMLNNVTSDHLSRALTLSLFTSVKVTTTMEEHRYELLDSGVTGSEVLLAVAFAGFRGTAQYDGVDDDNIDDEVYAALSQDTGFWDLAKAMVNNDLLKEVAKLQVATDSRIVGEGSLVPNTDADAAAEKASDEEETEDEAEEDKTLSPKPWLIAVVAAAFIVLVLIAVGIYLFQKYRHEKFLERKKAERRQLARQKRMMEHDRSSSYCSSLNTTGSDENSGLSKSPNKKSKCTVISKPSKEAKKESRLLRIIERNDEEGADEGDSDEHVGPHENCSEASYQSCQNSLTSFSCSPKKLAKGWSEHDVPDYLRNTRGFHTGALPLPQPLTVSPKTKKQYAGSMPQPLTISPTAKKKPAGSVLQSRTVSPTPIKKHVGFSDQKVRAPATWENRAGAPNGPITKLEKKVNPNDPNQVQKAGSTPSQINRTGVVSPRGGIAKTQVKSPRANATPPSPQVRQPPPQVRQPSPQVRQQPSPQVRQQPSPQVRQQPSPQVRQKPSPQVLQQPSPQVRQKPSPQVLQKVTTSTEKTPHNTGIESVVVGLNWSGSTMTNQYSLSSATTSTTSSSQGKGAVPQAKGVVAPPVRFTGHESMGGNLNWSGSTMSNQHSLSASASSSHADQVGEMFHNEGPPTPVKTKTQKELGKTQKELSMAQDSMALIKSPRSNVMLDEDDVDDMGLNFNMSMGNFDMIYDDDNLDDASDGMFEDAPRAHESMTFDEFSNDVGLDRPSQHTAGYGSLQGSSSTGVGSKISTSKSPGAASWRFT